MQGAVVAASALDRLEGLGPLPDTIAVHAFFDLAGTIITVRSLIRRSWTTHRWDERHNRRP